VRLLTIEHMKTAIELADNGLGFVNPNPLVGAVIVKNGRVIGKGYHERFGSNHAEVNAFLNATEDVEGADMYVTLEPCSHYGKTPPCALKIIEKKIKRVFISSIDPNPLVHLKGVELLKSAGIEVQYGILEEETRIQNEIFFKFVQTKVPFVSIKYAMTLDGKIASKTGDSKWITNEKSRAYVHDLRNKHMAIMVGVNTVVMDDPMLDTRRNQPSRNPIRIVIDPTLRIPIESKLVKTARNQRTIVVSLKDVNLGKMDLLRQNGVEVLVREDMGMIDMANLVHDLGKMEIDSILIEGGSFLHGKAMEAGVVDKAYVFLAPKILGGVKALTPVGGTGMELMSEAVRMDQVRVHRFDDDVLIEGTFKKIKGEIL